LNQPIFSNMDYYKNLHFQRCMRNWNIYLQSNEQDDEVLTEWEELLLKDFYQYSLEWFKLNKNNTFWRKELK